MAFLGVEEVLSLQSVGISTPLGPNNCYLASNNWLSTVDSSSGHVSIVNVASKEASKRPALVNSAAINPHGQFLAVRSGPTLEVHDLLRSNGLKSIQLTGKNVIFWKWVKNDILALVTETDVMHWCMADTSDPIIVMTRHSAALGYPINYRVNENLQWLMVVTATSVESQIVGTIQLHSLEKSCSQIIEGQAACFAEHKLLKNENVFELFAFVNFSPTKSELCIAPIGKPASGDSAYSKANGALQIPAQTASDFPMSVEQVKSLSLLLIVWKSAFVSIHSVENADCLYAVPIVSTAVFATVLNGEESILMVNKSGCILSANICVEKLLQHLETSNRIELAAKTVWRLELESNSHLINKWFEMLLSQNKIDEAVWVAASAPKGLLRTRENFDKLMILSGKTPSPILSYFKLLIDRGKLSQWESLELCRPVVQQGKLELVEKLLREEKLECCEELGDILFPSSKKLALSVFVRANAAPKAVMCFAEEGQYVLLYDYAEKVNYKPDLMFIITSFLKREKFEKAVNFTRWLATENKLSGIADQIVYPFIQNSLIKEIVQILEIFIEKNPPEIGALQTQLVKLYIQYYPNKAEEFLTNRSSLCIDNFEVAGICERAGLLHHALFLYNDLDDWRRVLVNAYIIKKSYLQNFFSTIDVSLVIPCLTSMLTIKENITVSIEMATFCVQRVPSIDLIKIFENLNDSAILFKLMSNLIHMEDDEHIHQKYMEVAVELGSICELINFCKTSTGLNAMKARNFLMSKNLKNAIPLMIVCDRFDFIDEMTSFLINSGMDQFFKYFLEHINRSRLVLILERALSLGAKDSLILDLIPFSNEDNLDESLSLVEQHGRLSVLLPWLEKMQKSGSRNKSLHTTLVKLKLFREQQPERYLQDNELYDTLSIGKFCSTINPELSIIAFTKGGHDSELLELCQTHGFIKQMTRYLLHRSDMDLWLKALSSDKIKKNAIVENIAYLVCSESFSAESICVSVKSLMAADLPHQLLKLLETLVFDCCDFADNKNLQNLFILTAIKVDKSLVKQLIVRLKNFDAAEIADFARKSQLFEEALILFRRCGALNLAMDLILNDLKDLQQAEAFAVEHNEPTLWIKLGESLSQSGNVEAAIDAFIQGGDTQHIDEVVKVATIQGLWDKLIQYLQVVNANTKDQNVEAELLYLYAKTNNLANLRNLSAQPIIADVRDVAERCFASELYEAASIMFEFAGCYSRLADTFAAMGNLKDSVKSARKANDAKCWRTLCYKALLKGDVEIACEAAQHVLVQIDSVEELVLKFEEHGLITDLISTFEKVIVSGNIGNAVTNFVILIIRHQPERCRHFLEEYYGSLHIPRVLNALKEAHMWFDFAYLLERHEDWHEAVQVMLDHPSEAFIHERFKKLLTKIGSSTLIESVIQFYLDYKPTLLNDLLIHLGQRVDARKVVAVLSAAGHLPLIRPFLEHRAKEDDQVINAACCQLYLEESDWLGLRTFLATQNNIDTFALALQLENHESVGFHAVAVELYIKCHRIKEAMRVCRRDCLYRKAIHVAELSGDKALVQELLKYFLEQNKSHHFTAALFKCFELIDPDQVLELTWTFNAWQYALPYFIQVVSNYTVLFSEIKSQMKSKQEDKEENALRMLTWNHKQ